MTDTSARADELVHDDDLIDCGTFRDAWARREEFRLMKDLRWVHPTLGPIVVPKGYVTDGFSLPGRWFAAIWQPKKKRWWLASILHDKVYETMEFGADSEGRGQADQVLRDAMLSMGVPRWKAWIVWAGVRLGGAKGYGQIDEDNIELLREHRADLHEVLA